MTTIQKESVKQKLAIYCERFESQNKAANSLKNVSSATISQMLNNNWDLIKDEMWQTVATQIGWTEKEWNVVETRDFKLINHFLNDAKTNSLVFGMVGDAGSGKSKALQSFVEQNKRTYLLSCAEYWNRKTFLAELLTKMGRDYSGFTVNEMMYEVIHNLKKQDKPCLILDEADKLNDQVLYFFITLYNQLEDECGIVLCATDHLAKRINRGLKLNKKGYKEIFSRLGRKFIELKGISGSDITAICLANGITEKSIIKQVVEDCENDLRRVKRKIHALKNINQA